MNEPFTYRTVRFDDDTDYIALLTNQFKIGIHRHKEDGSPADWVWKVGRVLPQPHKQRLSDALYALLSHSDAAVWKGARATLNVAPYLRQSTAFHTRAYAQSKRTYTDKNGVRIRLEQLCLSNIYHDMLEGYPHRLQEHTRRKIQTQLDTDSSLYIMGFSEPDEVVNARWADQDRWIPAEYVSVYCESRWIPQGKPSGKTYLTVMWYQDEGNPFVQFGDIIGRLDWTQLAVYEEMD